MGEEKKPIEQSGSESEAKAKPEPVECGVKCTPYDEVKDISFMRLDRWGNTEDVGYPLNKTRISVFVTSGTDSHHIEFKEPIERHKLATLLDDLAVRVRKGV